MTPEHPDWNWFFSSVAQSAAAIVGIFGAFVVTKIVNNQAEFERKRIFARELTNRALRFVDEANNRFFDWYNRHTGNHETNDLVEFALKKTKRSDLKTPDEYYAESAFSPFIPRAELVASIAELVEFYKTRASRESTDSFLDSDAARAFTDQLRRDDRNRITPRLEAEREEIDRLLIETRDHARKIETFVSEAKRNVESSRLLTWSIVAGMILFYVGVIYPASFLPSATRITLSLGAFWEILFSLKGVIWGAVSAVFTAIMLVFLAINARLKFPPKDLESLARFGDIASYSPYFATYTANTEAPDTEARRGEGDGR